MLIFLLICLLIGAVLGQRFKVLVLIPAIVPGGNGGGGLSPCRYILADPRCGSCRRNHLQIGYFAGVGVRHFMAVVRTNQIYAGSPAASTYPRRSAAKQL